MDSESEDFEPLIRRVFELSQELYPAVDPDAVSGYIVENASRATLVVLNSERDRTAAGDSATEPSSPFTIIIGGNIVSRGVTFPNLLAMFFTRDVSQRLQQDTYIQRARMFGAKGDYLPHFELTIPRGLYADWHRCFIFHRLALATITNEIGSPVWVADNRISVAASPSINKATVVLGRGEMSFKMFDFNQRLDDIVLGDQSSIDTLRKLRDVIGNNALPSFLIDYIDTVRSNGITSLAIHTASSIHGYRADDVDKDAISRRRGFMGKSQLEGKRFGEVLHHLKIFYNGAKRAKIFYKSTGSVQFVQNLRNIAGVASP